MIRKLTRADILPCVKLLEKFWHESTCHFHFGEWSPVYVQRALDQHFTSGSLVGWASFGEHLEMNSLLLAVIDKCFWKDLEILREIAWYTDQTKRGNIGAIKVYKEAEKFALENNIKKIIMGRIQGVPSYDKLDSFYLKNNFKSLEEEYIKELL